MNLTKTLPLAGALAFAGALMFAACTTDEAAKPDVKAPTPDLSVIADKAVDTAPIPDAPPPIKLTIKQLIPTSGFADKSTMITAIGTGFAQNMTVYIDGGANGGIITALNIISASTFSFTIPPNPNGTKQSNLVTIQVWKGSEKSNIVYYRYFLVATSTTKFFGGVVTTTTDAFRDYPSPKYTGRLYIEGLTDAQSTPKLGTRAQIGMAVVPPGTTAPDPTKDSSFRWWDAAFLKQEGKFHLYQGSVTPSLSNAVYHIAYRFSKDDGKTWIFADTKESDLKYLATDAAKIKVTIAPLNFCLSKADCTASAYLKACKVDTSDWKKGRCVGCLAAKDCTDNTAAFGPLCNLGTNVCYCAVAKDCDTKPKANINGKLCNTKGKYCGCTGDKDCDYNNKQKCMKVGKNPTLQICQ